MHGNCRYLGRVELQVALLPEGLEVLLLGILTQRFLTQVSSRLSVTFGDFKIHLCKHFHLEKLLYLHSKVFGGMLRFTPPPLLSRPKWQQKHGGKHVILLGM